MKVIYDGECPVCISLKDFCESKMAGVEYTPFQNIDQAKEARGSLYVVGNNGISKHGARAVFEIMRQMSGLWGILGYVFSLPPFVWIAEPCYRLFARHRHTVSRLL